jgi:hypothetical protein
MTSKQVFKDNLFIVPILMALVFALNVRADSINIKAGSKVNHIAKGEWNEDNRLIGVEYQFNDNIIIEHSEFINSYSKPTQFDMVTLQYHPINYEKVKIGGGISFGRQEGYCTKGWDTLRCKDGMSDVSPIILPFIGAELDNFIVRYTYIPNSVEIFTFGFKAVEF